MKSLLRRFLSRNRTRRLFGVMLIGVAGPWVVLLWLCFGPMAPIPISRETTYLTAPLTADGKYVDYFEYVRALEETPGAKPASEDPWCKLTPIGPAAIAAAPKDQPQYAEFGPYFKRWLDEHPEYEADGKRILISNEYRGASLFQMPIRSPLHPAFQEFLDANAPWYEAIRASEPTVAMLDISPNDSSPHLSRVLLRRSACYRQIADRFNIRVVLQFQRGDFDAAIEDSKMMLKAAASTERAFWVAQSVSWVVQRQVCDVLVHGLAEDGPLSDTSYIWLLKLPVDIAPDENIVESLDACERFISLDVIQQMHRTSVEDLMPNLKLPPSLQAIGARYAARRIDYGQLMKDENAAMDRAIEALKSPTYAERVASFKAGAPTLAPAFVTSPGLSLSFLSTDFHSLAKQSLNPPWRDLATLPEKMATQLNSRRVLHLVTRLSLWKKLHGSYPTSLAELATIPGWPDAPANAMTDAFTEKPFAFESDGNSFTIRCAGPDMILGAPNDLDDVRWPMKVDAR